MAIITDLATHKQGALHWRGFLLSTDNSHIYPQQAYTLVRKVQLVRQEDALDKTPKVICRKCYYVQLYVKQTHCVKCLKRLNAWITKQVQSEKS